MMRSGWRGPARVSGGAAGVFGGAVVFGEVKRPLPGLMHDSVAQWSPTGWGRWCRASIRGSERRGGPGPAGGRSALAGGAGIDAAYRSCRAPEPAACSLVTSGAAEAPVSGKFRKHPSPRRTELYLFVCSNPVLGGVSLQKVMPSPTLRWLGDWPRRPACP